MQHTEFELGVGDSIRVGNQIITVVEISADDVGLKIDDADFAAEVDPMVLAGEVVIPLHG